LTAGKLDKLMRSIHKNMILTALEEGPKRSHIGKEIGDETSFIRRGIANLKLQNSNQKDSTRFYGQIQPHSGRGPYLNR
jgi:hypothetical protein